MVMIGFGGGWVVVSGGGGGDGGERRGLGFCVLTQILQISPCCLRFYKIVIN